MGTVEEEENRRVFGGDGGLMLKRFVERELRMPTSQVDSPVMEKQGTGYTLY